MTALHIPEGHSLVLGRSRQKAADLLEAAEAKGFKGQVSTTSDGYIVPTEVADAVDGEAAEKRAKEQADAEAQAKADAEAAQAQADAEAKAKEAEGQATTADATANAELFDPTDHKVEEVQAYLETADEAERTRVLAVEEAGKKRVSLLDNTEGAK